MRKKSQANQRVNLEECQTLKEENKMDFTDTKLIVINTVALLISFSDIEIILKICLLTVTIGYTITKWKDAYENRKDK